MTQQLHNKMVKIAKESGDIRNSDEYEVMTLKEFKTQLIEDMDISNKLCMFIDWNGYIENIIYDDDVYCWIQYDIDADEYESSTRIRHGTNGYIVKAT